MIDARDAMTEGRFDQAILDLDRASRVTGLSDEEALELAFLRAQCLEALRRTEEATALYRLVPSNASSAELVDGAAARLRELGARAPENGRI